MKLKSLLFAFAMLVGANLSHAAGYVEDFEAAFPVWESGWLGTNSNLTNYYGVGGGRGNNPDGLWIGVTDIQFAPTFGAGIQSLSLDIASWVNGTVNFYDSANSLIASLGFTSNQGAYTDPGTYQNLAVTSNNGISHVDFVGAGILGNTSIDNVMINVSAVPEPETYAMLLAGLGLMGAVARRRNRAA